MLGAFKLARFAYDRLQRQRVPPFWQDQIDLDMLTVQVIDHEMYTYFDQKKRLIVHDVLHGKVSAATVLYRVF